MSAAAPQTPVVFLRLPEVMRRTGKSKTEVYRAVKAKKFPAPQRLSHKVSVWIEAQVVAWQMSQIPDDRQDLLG